MGCRLSVEILCHTFSHAWLDGVDTDSEPEAEKANGSPGFAGEPFEGGKTLRVGVTACACACAGTGRLPALLLAGLFEVTVRAELLHETLLIEDLLHPLQCAADVFALLQTNLNHESHPLSPPRTTCSRCRIAYPSGRREADTISDAGLKSQWRTPFSRPACRSRASMAGARPRKAWKTSSGGVPPPSARSVSR